MKRVSPLISFTLLLLFLLGISFFIQFNLTQKYIVDLSAYELLLPYLANFLLAFTITVILYRLREKQAHNLGFIFMGSSFVKFAVFFIGFYPFYNVDGDVSKIEFAQFFVPYAVSLTVETIFLIKILNQMD